MVSACYEEVDNFVAIHRGYPWLLYIAMPRSLHHLHLSLGGWAPERHPDLVAHHLHLVSDGAGLPLGLYY